MVNTVNSQTSRVWIFPVFTHFYIWLWVSSVSSHSSKTQSPGEMSKQPVGMILNVLSVSGIALWWTGNWSKVFSCLPAQWYRRTVDKSWADISSRGNVWMESVLFMSFLQSIDTLWSRFSSWTIKCLPDSCVPSFFLVIFSLQLCQYCIFCL